MDFLCGLRHASLGNARKSPDQTERRRPRCVGGRCRYARALAGLFQRLLGLAGGKFLQCLADGADLSSRVGEALNEIDNPPAKLHVESRERPG
jgi:hypothetical protein